VGFASEGSAQVRTAPAPIILDASAVPARAIAITRDSPRAIIAALAATGKAKSTMAALEAADRAKGVIKGIEVYTERPAGEKPIIEGIVSVKKPATSVPQIAFRAYKDMTLEEQQAFVKSGIPSSATDLALSVLAINAENIKMNRPLLNTKGDVVTDSAEIAKIRTALAVDLDLESITKAALVRAGLSANSHDIVGRVKTGVTEGLSLDKSLANAVAAAAYADNMTEASYAITDKAKTAALIASGGKGGVFHGQTYNEADYKIARMTFGEQLAFINAIKSSGDKAAIAQAAQRINTINLFAQKPYYTSEGALALTPKEIGAAHEIALTEIVKQAGQALPVAGVVKEPVADKVTGTPMVVDEVIGTPIEEAELAFRQEQYAKQRAMAEVEKAEKAERVAAGLPATKSGTRLYSEMSTIEQLIHVKYGYKYGNMTTTKNLVGLNTENMKSGKPFVAIPGVVVTDPAEIASIRTTAAHEINRINVITGGPLYGNNGKIITDPAEIARVKKEFTLSYGEGGVVLGAEGVPVLVVAHGGELVLPTDVVQDLRDLLDEDGEPVAEPVSIVAQIPSESASKIKSGGKHSSARKIRQEGSRPAGLGAIR
jgi:hypothetical protein